LQKNAEQNQYRFLSHFVAKLLIPSGNSIPPLDGEHNEWGKDLQREAVCAPHIGGDE
jgi:hypothetical protein